VDDVHVAPCPVIDGGRDRSEDSARKAVEPPVADHDLVDAALPDESDQRIDSVALDGRKR